MGASIKSTSAEECDFRGNVERYVPGDPSNDFNLILSAAVHQTDKLRKSHQPTSGAIIAYMQRQRDIFQEARSKVLQQVTSNDRLPPIAADEHHSRRSVFGFTAVDLAPELCRGLFQQNGRARRMRTRSVSESGGSPLVSPHHSEVGCMLGSEQVECWGCVRPIGK